MANRRPIAARSMQTVPGCAGRSESRASAAGVAAVHTKLPGSAAFSHNAEPEHVRSGPSQPGRHLPPVGSVLPHCQPVSVQALILPLVAGRYRPSSQQSAGHVLPQAPLTA